MAERVYIKSTLAAVVLLAAAGWTASASAGDESPAASAATTPVKAAITSVLSAYEAALNASDTDAVRRLYADDVVLMRPFRPSVVGKAAVRQPSVAGPRVSKLNIKFTIAEIVEMAPDWAFARTNSAGTITVTATGATSPEANQELFIFR
jgi:ketosteroid isomerase-like protein